MDTRSCRKQLNKFIHTDGLDDEVLEPPIKKQKQECLPRILDGTYFEVVERNMDNVHAICKLCGVKRKGTIRSTGNFLTHIKRSHPTKLTEIEEYRKLKQNESSIRRSMTTTDPLTATEAAEVLIRFVTDTNSPFSIIQKPSFREMIRRFAGRDVFIPNTPFFMKTMNESFDTMKTKMKAIIETTEYVCVTCDVWSSRAQSYLGMTLHYIESDYSRKSFLLAFTQLKGKQTNQELAAEMFAIFNKFDIHTSKITNVVTDGGSAFCKAFKVFGKNSDAYCEPIEPRTIEEDGEEEISFDSSSTAGGDSNKDMPFMQYDDGENFFANVIMMDVGAEYIEEDEGDEFFLDKPNTTDCDFPNCIDIFDELDIDNENDAMSPGLQQSLPKQRRCLSHLLNLTASDFQKKLTGTLKNIFHATLAKLHSIWVFPRRSGMAKTIASEILGKQMKIPCETRWNSLYDSILGIYDSKLEKINTFVDTIREKMNGVSHIQRLSQEDWVVITAYLKVMGPVAKSLDLLQGDKHIGQGYILPTLLSIRTHISGLKGGSVVSGFRNVMMDVIDKRFASYISIDEANRELLLAAITTPLFKHTFLESDSERITAENVLASESLISGNSSATEEVSPNDQETNIEDDFFILYPSYGTARRQSLEKIVEEENLRYLCDTRKNLEMLNDYPRIKKMYFKYNTTLPSSAAVERIFSQSKLIFTHLRNRILGNNFEKALMLKVNLKNLDATKPQEIQK